MNLQDQYVFLNKSILNLYQYSTYHFDKDFVSSINDLNKHVERLNSDLIVNILEINGPKLDVFIENELCASIDFYLLKVELHLRIIILDRAHFGNKRLSRFLDCLINIYSLKQEKVEFERTLYLAGLLGEYLLDMDFNLNSTNREKVKKIMTWQASETGNWYGYNDHYVKLKSFV